MKITNGEVQNCSGQFRKIRMRTNQLKAEFIIIKTPRKIVVNPRLETLLEILKTNRTKAPKPLFGKRLQCHQLH